MNHFIDRRSFLTGGVTLASSWALAGAAPGSRRSWLDEGESEEGRNLVLIQLTGGNDGLSTVVPFADDAYHRARPSTAIKASAVRTLDDHVGLHPGLERLHAQYGDGNLAIVHGVGYPNPVRSHFQSYEIWHAAHPSGRLIPEGWIGRLCAAAWPDVNNTELVIHVGSGAPFSVHSEKHPPVFIASPTSYQWFGDQRKGDAWRRSGAALGQRQRKMESETEGSPEPSDDPGSGGRAVLSRLRQVLDVADASSMRVRRAAAAYRPSAVYPQEDFAANLRDIAAFIHGGLGTRVFSCELTGFDTHAKQKPSHDELMGTLDGGLGAFMEDLSNSSLGRETIVVVISEFGRRVAENESAGHDHGQAGPVLVLGHAVKGGMYGTHPSLAELDQGDITFSTDFRSIYATVIEDWFGVDSEPLLFGRFPKLELV